MLLSPKHQKWGLERLYHIWNALRENSYLWTTNAGLLQTVFCAEGRASAISQVMLDFTEPIYCWVGFGFCGFFYVLRSHVVQAGVNS